MKKHLRILGLSNELPTLGKPLVIPYGSFPHKVGKVLQLVNSKTALMMVNEFDAMASAPGFKGVPVFIGHPDVKGFYEKYPDHRSYAWITKMLVNETDQCLELYANWTAPGAELITNEHFAYFSPNWLAVKGQPGEALPFKIKSIGLTHEPMIEYLALACEDGGEDEPITQTEGNNMNKLLERLLALLPENVSKDITDDDGVVGFFQKMLDGLKAIRELQQNRWKAEDAAYMALENEDPVAGLTAYLDELAGQALALANEVPPDTAATLTQVTEELALANEGLATMRGAHSALLLDQALLDGRITPATRPKWDERFQGSDDFTELANELGSIDPTMKTTRHSKDGEPGDGKDATHADVIALANEYQQAGGTFEAAYGRAKRDPKFAHLFTSGQADAQ